MLPFEKGPYDPARCRSLREAAGLTRTQTGAAIDRTEHSIGCYETTAASRLTPPYDVVCRLAVLFGCDPADFYADASTAEVA